MTRNDIEMRPPVCLTGIGILVTVAGAALTVLIFWFVRSRFHDGPGPDDGANMIAGAAAIIPALLTLLGALGTFFGVLWLGLMTVKLCLFKVRGQQYGHNKPSDPILEPAPVPGADSEKAQR